MFELVRKKDNKILPAPTSADAKELIQAIVESAEGDLRSAINTLQLVSLQASSSSSSISTRGTKRLANGRTAKKGTSAKLDKRKIALLNGKETSLVLFHALGKILYNKRRGDPNDEDEEEGDDHCVDDNQRIEESSIEAHIPVSLPPHMSSLERRKSRVDPEVSFFLFFCGSSIELMHLLQMLWRSMPTDSSTLQAFLHQNYTQFCDTIEQCASLSEAVSEAAISKPAHEEVRNWQRIIPF